jgi:hypothetical protein
MRALVLSLVIIAAAAAGGAGAAAQTATTPLPPPAPAVSSPSAVVRELYKIHRNGYGPLFEKKGRKYHEKFFDRKLADLIWKDLTETPEGEVGHIDFDPLFNAQDTQIKNFRVGEAAVRGDAATVPVTFNNFDQKVKINFLLVRTKAGWKISNIIYGKDSDFVKILSEPM